MKKHNKYITLLALAVIVSAFFLPVTASADGTPPDKFPTSLPLPVPTPDPPQEEAPIDNSWWWEPPDIPGDDPSDTTVEPSPTPPQGSPWDDPPDDGNPFTPDGQGTVVDNATGDDGKEFFTFTTDAGNVFFLVIDRSRPQDNVYFLNAVTEQDLMALAESPDDTVFSPIPEPPVPPTPLPTVPDDEPEEPETSEEPEDTSGGSGTTIFMIIAALAFGGAVYYFKVVRPKKQGSFDDDEDEEEYESDPEYDEEYDEYEEDQEDE